MFRSHAITMVSMSMVQMLRQRVSPTKRRPCGVAARLAVMAIVIGSAAQPLFAQQSRLHYRHHSDLPPGAIGSAQLQRGGPLPGYFQPVEIKAPAGAEISLAAGGQFLDAQPAPVKAGLLVGGVYRFRVSRIPYEPGREVFPTVEVIDRLYPPAGQEKRFPIVVEIVQEDLELALAGKFVTRVVYLEEPRAALPASEEAIGGQNWFDAKPGDNPLEIADTMGRPVAILRMGAWLPINNQAMGPVDESLEPGLGPSLPLIRYPSDAELRSRYQQFEYEVPGHDGEFHLIDPACEPTAARVPDATRIPTASHIPTAARIPAAMPVGAAHLPASGEPRTGAARLLGWRGR